MQLYAWYFICITILVYLTTFMPNYDFTMYRNTSFRVAIIDNIPSEVFLKNVHLISEYQIVEWHYFLK